jgi:hypothetical protein
MKTQEEQEPTPMEILAQEMEFRAKVLFREIQETEHHLNMLEIEKRHMVRTIKRYNVPVSKEHDYLRIFLEEYDPERQKNKMEELVSAVSEEIDRAYERSKYEGRELYGIFHSIFELVGGDALKTFTKRTM